MSSPASSDRISPPPADRRDHRNGNPRVPGAFPRDGPQRVVPCPHVRFFRDDGRRAVDDLRLPAGRLYRHADHGLAPAPFHASLTVLHGRRLDLDRRADCGPHAHVPCPVGWSPCSGNGHRYRHSPDVHDHPDAFSALENRCVDGCGRSRPGHGTGARPDSGRHHRDGSVLARGVLDLRGARSCVRMRRRSFLCPYASARPPSPAVKCRVSRSISCRLPSSR